MKRKKIFYFAVSCVFCALSATSAYGQNKCEIAVRQLIYGEVASASIRKTEAGYIVTGIDQPITSKSVLRTSILDASKNASAHGADFTLRLKGFAPTEARELVGEIEVALKSAAVAEQTSGEFRTVTSFSNGNNNQSRLLAKSTILPSYWSRAEIKFVDEAGIATSVSRNASGATQIAEVRIQLVPLSGNAGSYISIRAYNTSLPSRIMYKVVEIIRRVLGIAERKSWAVDKTLIEIKQALKESEIDPDLLEIRLREETGDTIISTNDLLNQIIMTARFA